MLYYTSFVSAILKAARLGGDVMEQKQLIQYLAEKKSGMATPLLTTPTIRLSVHKRNKS